MLVWEHELENLLTNLRNAWLFNFYVPCPFLVLATMALHNFLSYVVRNIFFSLFISPDLSSAIHLYKLATSVMFWFPLSLCHLSALWVLKPSNRLASLCVFEISIVFTHVFFCHFCFLSLWTILICPVYFNVN